jgi:transcriptional regulator with XRE-family HTH domain
MGNNDTGQIKMIKVPVDEEHPVVDPLYWAEKQANRGAYGLLMPMTETARMIEAELAKVDSYSHNGSLYNQAGKALALKVKMPYFRVRARMIQLGHLHAKGALNFIKKVELRPFDFDTDSWRCDNHTFIIDELTMLNLRNKDEQFRELLDSEKYIYADGHVVRNTPRFVEMNRRGEMMLTDWAERNVDQCCIRFYRSYEQKNPGVYYYGRMNFDADYIKQTAFYLSDIVDEEKIDELDAKERYILSFPKGFKEGLDQLRKKKKISYDRLADYLGMDKATLLRWVEEPRYYRNKDFLTLICLILELPDWISRLVFRRAGTLLDEDNKRDRALQYILRAQSGEGKDEANDYLKRMNLAELAV